MPIIPDTPAGLAALEFFAAMCDKYRRPSDAVPAAEHPPAMPLPTMQRLSGAGDAGAVGNSGLPVPE
jgi:hypothetical protein